MEKFGLILTKVLTALTALGCALLTGWSFFTGQTFLLTLVGLLLTGVMGFFTYVDVKKLF